VVDATLLDVHHIWADLVATVADVVGLLLF